MSEIFQNYSLKNHNSFGLDVSCRHFFEATTLHDLQSFLDKAMAHRTGFLILGEGSNTLFTDDYAGAIIHPALKGIEIISEDENHVVVKASAGENWDDFVKYCVERNWSGLENLSLIPGSIGASPVQNIGAYGVEAKDCIGGVEGLFIETGTKKSFSNTECNFSYRSSIFKQELKGKFLITSVSFKLNKRHHFELSYGPVEKDFMSKPVQNLASLRQTIIEIRESKLPDPKKLGNSGSFFKNPVLGNSQFQNLKSTFPLIPSYPAGKENTKIPAAWLIEQCGWKGVREGDVGTYPSQPLVIVNYGGASGKEVIEFAGKIVDSIKEKFGVELEMEVNLIRE
jgi:UDP-N-acetylmuramate dehydrogenase